MYRERTRVGAALPRLGHLVVGLVEHLLERHQRLRPREKVAPVALERVQVAARSKRAVARVGVWLQRKAGLSDGLADS
eukprot:5786308-Pleurochrysis_carterae.AAC.1